MEVILHWLFVLFFPAVLRIYLGACLVLNFFASTCIYKSSFRVVHFSDVLPLGSFIFRKDTDICWASPFTWIPYLGGWLSHRILRVLYRSTLQLWDPFYWLYSPPSPGPWWSGRNALFWTVRSLAGHRRGLELGRAPRGPAFQQLRPPDCGLSSPSHTLWETGWMCKTARPVGVLNASFFNNSSAYIPYPCTRGL